MAAKAPGETLAQEAAMMRKLGLQLAALQEMGLADLRAQYRDLYGEEPKSKNLPFLRKRLAFRLQERVEGGLSPEARARIEELAPADLPIKTKPKASIPTASKPHQAVIRDRDPRLPEPGTLLQREHKGYAHEVEVLDQGFRYRNRVFTSLSTIAKEITGTAWNGFTYFGLKKGKVDANA